MDPQMQAVPVIDISPFFGGTEAEQKSVVHAWDRAFSSVGFAVIIGHGIPEEVVDDAYKGAKEFFGRPQDEKMAQCFGKGYGAGGFTPVGGERVSATLKEGPTRPPDLVENLLVHKRETDAIPHYPENYQKVMYR
jgi:isopenicillin N synthase-like dioxygenase